MDFLTEQISHLFATNQFFQGGLILAAASWVFYQLKALPLWVWRKTLYAITYETYFDEKSDFYDCFAQWMSERFPQKFRRTEVKIISEDGDTDYVKPRYRLRFFQSTDSNFLFYRRRLLFIRKSREKLENASSFWNIHLNSYSIAGVFAKGAIERLCEEILQVRFDREEQAGLEVRYNAEYGFTKKVLPITKTFDYLFFTDKQRLIDDLDRFSMAREKYLAKGIGYKRGYLLYGGPGTGKTSAAVAIARHLRRPLFVINLASIRDDKQLQSLALDVSSGSVVLFEDVDCVFEDRDVKGNDKLNFSTILNVLDGLYSPSDCVFVLTTNKPEAIDSALQRKGRIDMALHIDNPTTEDVEGFISSYYDTSVNLGRNGTLPFGMSWVQDVCLRNPTAEDAKKELLGGHVAEARAA